MVSNCGLGGSELALETNKQKQQKPSQWEGSAEMEQGTHDGGEVFLGGFQHCARQNCS